MENKIVYKVEDFLKDNDFINYVLGLSVDNEQKWKDLFERSLGQSQTFKEAKSVLLASSNVECDLTVFERSALKERILMSVNLEFID